MKAGKISYYGWSTDDVDRARLFAGGEHCIAIEHRFNVFDDNAAMLELCREQDLASLNRIPLLMGVHSTASMMTFDTMQMAATFLYFKRVEVRGRRRKNRPHPFA